MDKRVRRLADDKKICFIYCVNDQKKLKKSLETVKWLKVPSEFHIQHVFIEGASSMTSGYNSGMKETDAKYKIYIHQDVFILNSNFLIDIVSLCNKYPQLGLLGVVGAKRLPINGVWWKGREKYGKVYESSPGKMRLLRFREVPEDYESVEAIDGLIMVTQYDIPWREDLFKSWHFYDISQCKEFQNAGFEVGIPRQEEPWVLHDCGIVSVKGYENERKLFLKHYK